MDVFVNLGDVSFFPFCSPLLSFLHASINSSVIDGDLDLVNDAAFYLNYIFRAIKRAKDAVDAQRTPVRFLNFFRYLCWVNNAFNIGTRRGLLRIM